jgi:hypothetical protein
MDKSMKFEFSYQGVAVRLNNKKPSCAYCSQRAEFQCDAIIGGPNDHCKVPMCGKCTTNTVNWHDGRTDLCRAHSAKH